jgi:translation initiation factor 2-alpha kinase 4
LAYLNIGVHAIVATGTSGAVDMKDELLLQHAHLNDSDIAPPHLQFAQDENSTWSDGDNSNDGEDESSSDDDVAYAAGAHNNQHNKTTHSIDVVFDRTHEDIDASHTQLDTALSLAAFSGSNISPIRLLFIQVGSVRLRMLHVQMEYCEKSTLRQSIDLNEVWKQPTRAWRLLREACEGLAHVHAQGMVHRDIKPMNIFLDAGDHAKIGDFGLATQQTSLHNVSQAYPNPHSPGLSG